MKFYKSLSLFFLKYLYKYRIRWCKISCVNTKRNKSVIVELRNITRRRFIPMTQFTTELLNFLAQKQDIDEFFRTSLKTAMNDLLQAELSAFLEYEPYDKVGYNFGNSRISDQLDKLEKKAQQLKKKMYSEKSMRKQMEIKRDYQATLKEIEALKK